MHRQAAHTAMGFNKGIQIWTGGLTAAVKVTGPGYLAPWGCIHSNKFACQCTNSERGITAAVKAKGQGVPPEHLPSTLGVIYPKAGPKS